MAPLLRRFLAEQLLAPVGRAAAGGRQPGNSSGPRTVFTSVFFFFPLSPQREPRGQKWVNRRRLLAPEPGQRAAEGANILQVEPWKLVGASGGKQPFVLFDSRQVA